MLQLVVDDPLVGLDAPLGPFVPGMDVDVAGWVFLQLVHHLLWNYNLVILVEFLLEGLLFLLLALLFSLGHDELVGRDSLAHEVDVQGDEVDEEKGEDGVDASADPGQDEAEQVVDVGLLGGQNGQGYEVDHQHHKGADDHREEVAVVGAAHTVVDPHAVVVEVLNAPVAGFAVPGLLLHETLAKVAVEQFPLECLLPLVKTTLSASVLLSVVAVRDHGGVGGVDATADDGDGHHGSQSD